MPAKMYSGYFCSPAGAFMPRHIWKTNTQLSSNTSGWMRPQIHPTAEPTKRCSKSRRTSWNSRLRRSTRFRKNRVPGTRKGTVNGHNTIVINNLQPVDKDSHPAVYPVTVWNSPSKVLSGIAPPGLRGRYFAPNPKGSPAGESMKQEYFVVVLAHSLRGRLRRVHIPHTAVYAVLGLAILGGFSAFGFVASYARMAWKVANYNALKQDADSMRARYQNLQKVVSETKVQMASLQLYVREVSVAYGIKQKLEGPSDISSEGKMVPSFTESLQEYNYLVNADKLSISNRRSRRIGGLKAPPSLWPVEGRLMDSLSA